MPRPKSGRVKVVALQRESLVAPGVASLSVSARVTEVLDYMEDKGLCEYASISEADACAPLAVEWADVLILSKHNSAEALGLAQLANSLGVGIVYDIDDWIFGFPSYSGGRKAADRAFVSEILELADVVTVANERLLHRVPRKFPSLAPILLPNGMWVERYASRVEQVPDLIRPRVLFTNADFLKVQSAKDSILTALHVFFRAHPDFVLDFFGDPFPEMFSLPFLHFTNRIPYQDYMRSIVAGGYLFAITPLGASEDAEAVEFNACKNPFKYINYGTAGIAGIYSDAEIYTSCVVPGATGMLVPNDFESWRDAMEIMAGDARLREDIRRQSHEDVKNRFHVKRSSEVLQDIIDRLMA